MAGQRQSDCGAVLRTQILWRPDSKSPASQTTRLLMDLEGLLDRAVYPDVNRLVPSGAPTTNELSQIQARLQQLKSSYQTQFADRVAGVTSEKDELNLAVEINSYFTSAQKFEGLKIIMNQSSNPQTMG